MDVLNYMELLGGTKQAELNSGNADKMANGISLKTHKIIFTPLRTGMSIQRVECNITDMKQLSAKDTKAAQSNFSSSVLVETPRQKLRR